MSIIDWIMAHPDEPFRILLYIEAPDALDENGDLICGGEGETHVVFDSALTPDVPFDLVCQFITAINTGDDGVTELEYISGDLF